MKRGKCQHKKQFCWIKKIIDNTKKKCVGIKEEE